MPRLMRICGVVRVGAVHVVALFVGHHLERELVVVAQEHRPLAVRRDLRRLRQDVDDREAILHVNRHEHPRHDRKVEVHVALVAVAEVGGGVLGPLVRLGEQHAVLELARRRARAASSGTRASRAGSRSSCPRARRGRARRRAAGRRRPCSNQKSTTLEQRLVHRRVLEVEIRLMRVEAMPVVGAWPRGSQDQFDGSKSLKMMRASR